MVVRMRSTGWDITAVRMLKSKHPRYQEVLKYRTEMLFKRRLAPVENSEVLETSQVWRLASIHSSITLSTRLFQARKTRHRFLPAEEMAVCLCMRESRTTQPRAASVPPPVHPQELVAYPVDSWPVRQVALLWPPRHHPVR